MQIFLFALLGLLLSAFLPYSLLGASKDDRHSKIQSMRLLVLGGMVLLRSSRLGPRGTHSSGIGLVQKHRQ